MAVLFDVVDSSVKAQSISNNLLQNWGPIGAVSPELPGNISPFISGFEIAAHFSIGQTDRALDLIRRCWGWYINNPNGTESTVIEGYLANATFGYRSSRGYDYDSSYVSHSHGWSSGPTATLTTYVLGLSILSPAGAKCRYRGKPHTNSDQFQETPGEECLAFSEANLMRQLLTPLLPRESSSTVWRSEQCGRRLHHCFGKIPGQLAVVGRRVYSELQCSPRNHWAGRLAMSHIWEIPKYCF
jgi:hypothetical protein